jgi:hypothetical protein
MTIALVADRMASTERTGPLESCLSEPYRALSSSGVIAASRHSGDGASRLIARNKGC